MGGVKMVYTCDSETHEHVRILEKWLILTKKKVLVGLTIDKLSQALTHLGYRVDGPSLQQLPARTNQPTPELLATWPTSQEKVRKNLELLQDLCFHDQLNLANDQGQTLCSAEMLLYILFHQSILRICLWEERPFDLSPIEPLFLSPGMDQVQLRCSNPVSKNHTLGVTIFRRQEQGIDILVSAFHIDKDEEISALSYHQAKEKGRLHRAPN